jgi:hypothetical protein
VRSAIKPRSVQQPGHEPLEELLEHRIASSHRIPPREITAV